MKGCLISILILLACSVLAGVGAYRMYQQFTEDFPDSAREDAVYARYGALISEVQTAIANSRSMYDLAAKLEQLDKPDELVYLALEKESDDPFEEDLMVITQQVDVSSRWQTLIGSTGHGELEDVPVIIISLPVERHSIRDCLIYLRYEPAPKKPDYAI